MRIQYLAVLILLILFDRNSNAALLTVDLSATLASAEQFGTIGNQGIQFSVSMPYVTIQRGDSLKAKLMFNGGESFGLLFDPQSQAIGTQGFLVLSDVNFPTYSAEFGFEFGFLDFNENVLLSDSAARVVRTGGDMRGDVTILQIQSLDVSGLFLQFNDITYSAPGDLPLTFGGIRFLVTNAVFSEPFLGGDVEPVPEPATIAVIIPGVLALILRRSRFSSQTTARSVTRGN